MKHSKLLRMVAWLAVLSIGMIGEVFAQVPSLVTQQTRLSTGGPTPSYVQLRAKAGVGTSTDAYFWDQAPAPTANTNYSLWLDANNNIVRSNPFGPGQSNYLMQVNATGTGLQWVNPANLTTLAGDIIGQTGDDSVNVGHSGLNNRLILGINNATGYDGTSLIAIDRGGTNSNAVPTAGAIAYGDGTKYMFNAVGTTGQILASTGAGVPIWVNSPSLLTFDNGLTKTLDNVQFGGPLVKATSVDQATFGLTFTNGTLDLGSAVGTYDINIDLGNSATHNMNMKNIAVDLTAPNILALDAAGNVRTRTFGSIITADNGLITNGLGLVSMGAPATGGALLLTDRFIGLATHKLTYEGAGDFNIGDGTSAQNITLDPSATGSTNFKNLANQAAPAATDRFVMMSTGSDKAFTRTLASLVNADNGLVVDNTVTPGTSTVQLGAPATGGALLLSNRFIGLRGFALNFDGDGSINMGASGNVNVNVNTGATGNMTLQGTTLSAGAGTPKFDNMAFVDGTTNNVRIAKTTDITTNATPTMFITVDATGNITKSVSPTTGFAKGQIAGNGSYQYTSPVIATGIVAGASITCTVQNMTGITGTILVQVTGVNTAAGTFTVETSESIQNGSFINYVVMN